MKYLLGYLLDSNALGHSKMVRYHRCIRLPACLTVTVLNDWASAGGTASPRGTYNNGYVEGGVSETGMMLWCL